MPTLINRLVFISFCILLFAACRSEQEAAALPREVDFNFHIRPILSNHCFTCHGPDESSRQAGLRLDTYEGATALLESGKQAIVPGHWKRSEAIRRIASEEAEVIMPPPDANNPVSERDLALLKKWIRQGAEWKDYWAFLPPDTAVYDPELSIDHFINAQLELQGLEAAPEADKRQLARRLSYLLTGLPPKSDLIEHYVNDDAPDAYEQLVDQLLASPDFGERWARHWMDLVRYAETKGHEFDYPVIGAWRYRDYLIRAFNQDLPYDQLIREHLAGDLLEQQRYDPETGHNESLIGTVFYNMGEGKHSPVDIRKEEADRIDNIIDVTTKTFQGLTLACARCHDHKFDPLPTADYYALYGIFESARFTYYPTNSGLQAQARVDSIETHKQAIRSLIAGAMPAHEGPQVLATSQQFNEPEGPAAGAVRVLADFRKGDHQGWMVRGEAFAAGNALGEPEFDPDTDQLRGFAAAKASSRFGGIGVQGTLRSPTFTIDHDYLTARVAGQNTTVRLIIDNFQLIQAPIHGELTQELNSPDMTTIRMNLSMWRGSKAYLELLNGKMWKNRQRHDHSVEPDAWLEAEYAFLHDSASVQELPKLNALKNTPLRKKDLDQWAKGQTDRETAAALNRELPRANLGPVRGPISGHRDSIRAIRDRLYAFTSFGGVSEGDAVFSPVFIRGNHLQVSEERLPHRYLTAFKELYPNFSEQGSGRLELANAIADPDNPLTARVMVNRLWHHLFGRGLVETVDNFGLQGKIPTHPALLDHLALRFIEEDWSIKAMIREIALSDAFRRSTAPSEMSKKKDPQNLWLQHFPIRRLEAEAIRDGILAVSGRLDTSRFGPSVAVHLTPFMQGRGRPWESGPLDGDGRRSIYQAVRRNFLPPMMLTFDFPVPFSTFGNRNVSNVPAQSLNLMNDPFVQEQAEVWAQQILDREATFEERLDGIYRKAFARPPTEAEIEKARSFFAEQAALYQEVETQERSDSTGLASQEVAPDTEPKDPQLQTWADFCQVIFNIKEFIFLL
ncbi:PSD1 and planctomycete cytochrome C domain-containing protein [Flavilitoribacter nigricans]|uniref:Cytochrome c domain-containing protein n=1 Tax=Flavilitoribacter nigricans (strain ATCC 23147 / DSM 23189 / NBRC 102662 / NCIMB 1420 / SS-2) TaxID=1122177 RepID=A0A2D0NCV3_FLAN2|nr:PSD1 and planctomycete cytochrome C domain-containing protein [Flavilitoribacter nigricans]PHN06009.1 hypothetical protein CRP01_13650 [Flavilitoribacter nigricans DSM 23189 = NBRC 102662]